MLIEYVEGDEPETDKLKSMLQKRKFEFYYMNTPKETTPT